MCTYLCFVGKVSIQSNQSRQHGNLMKCLVFMVINMHIKVFLASDYYAIYMQITSTAHFFFSNSYFKEAVTASQYCTKLPIATFSIC